jgi:RNA polymerase sigma factor (sigma-70 family)
MVWQEAFPPTGGPAFDAESERERRLAAQARAGAEWALTALIARYQPTVVRYLTRLCGDQARARQLAQRIFQRMERRLHGPHGADNLRLWLLRACTEAGLDALRRPRSAPARLGGASVAGLLTEQTGKESAGLLHGGLRRLRQATGGVGRQARPLVWAEEPLTQAASGDASHAASTIGSESHMDETLDRLDPRDALRHRLVRMTLAELPYGDAQCLALHLVAGLNQAEVAKSLGITNSAARKRIVHGLALFSEHYSQAVQSLGLPVELGFGDAMPRAPIEPEPAAEPVPEPVVISSHASDDAQDEQHARGEDQLIAVNSKSTPDHGRDVLSGVSYLSEDDGEDEQDNESAEAVAAMSQRGSPDRRRDTPRINLDTAQSAYQPAPMSLDDLAGDTEGSLIAQQNPAPMSGGLITRVASDAIVGPIVDALPVAAADPDAPGIFGLPGPRSMPLAYELSSNSLPAMHDAPETTDIRMNWLDDSGLMTPLSFESIAVSSAVAVTSADEDAPLAFEATASPTSDHITTDEASTSEDAPLSYELTQSEAETRPIGDTGEMGARAAVSDTLAAVAIHHTTPLSESRIEETEALAAGQTVDDEPLALVADPMPEPPIIVPVMTASVMTASVVIVPVVTETDVTGPAMTDTASADVAPTAPVTLASPDASTQPASIDDAEDGADNSYDSYDIAQFDDAQDVQQEWQETPFTRPAHGAVTRSLEDIWDELTDNTSH